MTVIVVDLGFTFQYFGSNYTRVSINPNGYVCLGLNFECWHQTRPSSHDLLVGLNCDLDRIYYKNLDSNTADFALAKIYLNLFNPEFEPQQIFIVTYGNVLQPFGSSSTSGASFQIYLSTDTVKSFVTFKFKSCPKDLIYHSPSGLNYKRIDGNLQEIHLINGQQCTESNVGYAGVWVSDVTSIGKLKLFISV
jgi:hypothetical protein